MGTICHSIHPGMSLGTCLNFASGNDIYSSTEFFFKDVPFATLQLKYWNVVYVLMAVAIGAGHNDSGINCNNSSRAVNEIVSLSS